MATEKKTAKKKKKTTTSADQRLKTVLEYIGPEFIERGAAKICPEDVDRVVRDLGKIRRQFRSGRALARFSKEAKAMISLIEDYDDGRYRAIPFVSLARVVFTLQYVLKPIDIIPDSLPVIGELDDALVVAHCLALVRQDLRAYGVWRLAADLER